MTFCLVLAIAYTLISISPLRNESAGLFTSAAVFAYTGAPAAAAAVRWMQGWMGWGGGAKLLCVAEESSVGLQGGSFVRDAPSFPPPILLPAYYTWSALNSEPVGACSAASLGTNKTLTVVGFVMAILVVSTGPAVVVLAAFQRIALLCWPPVANLCTTAPAAARPTDSLTARPSARPSARPPDRPTARPPAGTCRLRFLR